MFTGIIECLGIVKAVELQSTNKIFTIESSISSALKVDQSVSHNGVCLTVTSVEGDRHTVVAVNETLQVSNLDSVKVNDSLNLERCVKADARMDGHFVQGHVDGMGKCDRIKNENGSWLYTFLFDPQHAALLVSKGSITINGTSLTVIQPTTNSFQVAIIPYTFENTNFKLLKKGDWVNLEFDIIGKYILRKLELTGK